MERSKFVEKASERIRSMLPYYRRCKRINLEPISTSQSDVWDHTSALIQDIKSKTEPYEVTLQGVTLVILPNVFRPTTETALITDHIHTSSTERVLDMTTGSGGAAVIAGLQGASGYAIDINPQAVTNANINFERHMCNIHAIQSDLFQAVPLEKFDLILCNPPYYEGTPKEPLEYAIFGGRSFITALFENMRQYMNPTGKALITYAEWAGDAAFFEKTAVENGYAFSVIDKRSSEDGKRIYRLYEITL